ncbi:MAG: LemA family protein [Candidatus Eisenbacteria bacterium]|nr:LemA family protein [Candidatus Eisenbacteria bacterium]
MKQGGLIALAVVALLLLFLGGCLVGNYNGLVTGRETVNARWSEVNNQLQRRNDLIVNLFATVKGTAIQEQEVFGEIARARAAMAGARTRGDSLEADAAMNRALGGSALSRLLVVMENYPQLRSNEAFLSLMDELSGTENRLAVARGRYNDEVKNYNLLVKRFPSNLFASAFAFREQAYYTIADTVSAVPRPGFEGLRNR